MDNEHVICDPEVLKDRIEALEAENARLKKVVRHLYDWPFPVPFDLEDWQQIARDAGLIEFISGEEEGYTVLTLAGHAALGEKP